MNVDDFSCCLNTWCKMRPAVKITRYRQQKFLFSCTNHCPCTASFKFQNAESSEQVEQCQTMFIPLPKYRASKDCCTSSRLSRFVVCFSINMMMLISKYRQHQHHLALPRKTFAVRFLCHNGGRLTVNAVTLAL